MKDQGNNKNFLYQLFFLTLFLLVLIFIEWQFSPSQKIAFFLEKYFNQFGLWIVFISALVEGFFILNLYYPGGSAIFLGVIFASSDLSQVISTVAVATLGLWISYNIDFFLGRRGLFYFFKKLNHKGNFIKRGGKFLEKHKDNSFFLGFWHPNLASIISVAFGLSKFSFKKFFLFSLLAVSFWDIFWGALVYFLGEKALQIVGIRILIAIIFFWILLKLMDRMIIKKIAKQKHPA